MQLQLRNNYDKHLGNVNGTAVSIRTRGDDSLSSGVTHLALATHSRVASLAPATTDVFLGAITITGATNSAGAILSEIEKEEKLV